MTSRKEYKQLSMKQLRALNEERRKIGREIDPETASAFWMHVDLSDPYGDDAYSSEYSCIGRAWFALAKGGGPAIFFPDLPDETAMKLSARIDAGEFDRDDLSFLND